MTRFDTFADAQAYVQEHGRIGYQAPMDHKPGTLPASVEPSGSITVHIHQWVHDVEMGPNGYQEGPGYWESYDRTATESEPAGHADRLRKPGA